jgi:nitrate reductase NapAB chaperone NapD
MPSGNKVAPTLVHGRLRGRRNRQLIVNAWPQYLNAADPVLEAGGTEIHGRNPNGKRIVVMEARPQGESSN